VGQEGGGMITSMNTTGLYKLQTRGIYVWEDGILCPFVELCPMTDMFGVYVRFNVYLLVGS